MSVPEQAIEAAVRAELSGPSVWDDMADPTRATALKRVQVIVEAAAPCIAAQALRDAAAAYEPLIGSAAAVWWLRDRADRIERGEP